MLRILDGFMGHTPSEEGLPTAVNGDVASVEMMTKVKTESGHKVTSEGLPSTKDTFKCVYPVAGEFHKWMLHMDDTMKVFKTGEPVQRGTVEDFRTVTGTRNVTPVSEVQSN